MGSLPWFSFFYGLNLFVDSLMLEYGAWMHSKMDCNNNNNNNNGFLFIQKS